MMKVLKEVSFVEGFVQFLKHTSSRSRNNYRVNINIWRFPHGATHESHGAIYAKHSEVDQTNDCAFCIYLNVVLVSEFALLHHFHCEVNGFNTSPAAGHFIDVSCYGLDFTESASS